MVVRITIHLVMNYVLITFHERRKAGKLDLRTLLHGFENFHLRKVEIEFTNMYYVGLKQKHVQGHHGES